MSSHIHYCFTMLQIKLLLIEVCTNSDFLWEKWTNSELTKELRSHQSYHYVYVANWLQCRDYFFRSTILSSSLFQGVKDDQKFYSSLWSIQCLPQRITSRNQFERDILSQQSKCNPTNNGIVKKKKIEDFCNYGSFWIYKYEQMSICKKCTRQ